MHDLNRCFSAQVAVSTNKEVDAHIPNYPSLPPQLICQLHNLTMHVRLVYLFTNLFILLQCKVCLFWFPCFKVSHVLLIPALFFLFVHLCWIQADTETDEVYAQMTLQPLNPV